jgi:hypothetical protein
VTPDRVVTFRPDEDVLVAMEALKERDGIPYSEQIRRALREWLVSKGMLKAASRRVGARRKA